MGKAVLTDSFEGYSILSSREVDSVILKALISLGKKAVGKFDQPYAVFITLSFKKSWIDKEESKNREYRVKHRAPIVVFMDRFIKAFNRPGAITKAKDIHSPGYLWVKENKRITATSKEWYQVGADEKKDVLENGYEHFHVWLFIDYSKTSIEAIEKLLQREFDKGVIRHNHKYISVENGLKGIDAKRKCLKTRFEDFVKHGSYAAKKETKATKGKTWSCSSV